MAGNVRSIWNQKILGFEIAVIPAPLRREFQHAVVRVRDAPGSPAPILIVPKVQIMGAILVLLHMIPFTRPIHKAARIPKAAAIQIFTSHLIANTPVTAPDIAIVEPTDKSIPPDAKTTVIPIASSALQHMPTIVELKFDHVRK